jgi:hypothetical protein
VLLSSSPWKCQREPPWVTEEKSEPMMEQAGSSAFKVNYMGQRTRATRKMYFSSRVLLEKGRISGVTGLSGVI